MLTSLAPQSRCGRAAVLVVPLLLSIMVPTSPLARVWHVRPDSTGEAPTIQAAVDSAEAGDEVLLAPGTYTWTSQGGLPTLATMIQIDKPITLRGEAGASATVLDAERRARVVTCGVPVTVRGLTIRGGQSPMGIGGGGINMTGGLLEDCKITDNRTTFITGGGGVAMSNGVVQDCEISGNQTGLDGRGGGAALYRVQLIRCLVRENIAVGDPGGSGGGVVSSDSKIMDCRFEDNEAGGPFGSSGGAIQAARDSIIRCVFIGNRASSDITAGSAGGAIAAAAVFVSECVFIGNGATGSPNVGGCLSTILPAQAWVERCTFLENSSGVHNAMVTRSIIAKCTAGPPCSGTAVVTCSDVYANFTGDDLCRGSGSTGNITADPEFCAVDPTGSENVFLQKDSPCANAACGLMGARGLGCQSVTVVPVPMTAIKKLYGR